jgi:uncharacterized protein YidB (DUF937 family)
MAGIEDVIKELGGKGKQKDLVNNLVGMLGGSGGVSGLLQGFKESGLGEKAESWVSSGPNKPVSGDEVEKALGAEKVNELAQKSGVSPDEAKGGLASMLPVFINKLTPDGKLPDGLDDQVMGIAKKLLG